MTGRKKGVSIGAAMKQRMGQGEEETVQAPQRVPSIPNTPLQEEAAPVQTAAADEPLESFNTRLPRALQRRLKVHAATTGVKIQDIVQDALESYLLQKESKIS